MPAGRVPLIRFSSRVSNLSAEALAAAWAMVPLSEFAERSIVCSNGSVQSECGISPARWLDDTFSIRREVSGDSISAGSEPRMFVSLRWSSSTCARTSPSRVSAEPLTRS
eukprot:1092731-Pleurochrysis_carterae.AAC.1